jgi:hypothetical protein
MMMATFAISVDYIELFAVVVPSLDGGEIASPNFSSGTPVDYMGLDQFRIELSQRAIEIENLLYINAKHLDIDYDYCFPIKTIFFFTKMN